MHAVEHVIETDRLLLMPLTLAHAAAMVNGYVPEDARWVEGYPTDGTLVAAGILVTAHAERRDLGPFTIYQLVRREDGFVVGDVGFEGPPDPDGTVHLSFGIAEGARGQGYAVEGLTGLIGWARERSEVSRIVAEVHRSNRPTISVLEDAGLHLARRVGDHVCYEI
jgi:RimJ/RimL family protein N-acetyltransferase